MRTTQPSCRQALADARRTLWHGNLVPQKGPFGVTRTSKQVDKEPGKKPDAAVEEKAKEPAAQAKTGDTPAKGTTYAAKPGGKKPLGAKEVPRFEWKLLGESHGMILTLFKAVDLAEVEAQLERVRKEGYYTHLRIVEADMKIKQPKPPKSAKKATKAVKTTRTAAATAKRTKKATAKPAKSTKKVTKATPSAPRAKASATKTATSKAPRETTTKATKKKAPAAKSTKKATAKKKKTR